LLPCHNCTDAVQPEGWAFGDTVQPEAWDFDDAPNTVYMDLTPFALTLPAAADAAADILLQDSFSGCTLAWVTLPDGKVSIAHIEPQKVDPLAADGKRLSNSFSLETLVSVMFQNTGLSQSG